MLETHTELMQKLKQDIAIATLQPSDQAIRFLVDAYYMIQRDRIRAKHQAETAKAAGETSQLLFNLAKAFLLLEKEVLRSLNEWSFNHPVGSWLHSLTGIGPVLAAGFLSIIDIEQAPVVGHIWRFAGLDPTVQWLGVTKSRALVNAHWTGKEKKCTNELAATLRVATKRRLPGIEDMTKEAVISTISKRPWNSRLKVLCWKAGDSFVKTCNHRDAYYGKIYLQRKAVETEANDRGDYSELAAAALKEKNYGKTTAAYKAYSEGKLPKARIQLRASRYTVKLFLSHLHHKLYEAKYGKPPPLPYAIAILGHGHYIPPPD